jgi:hypothetical protein
MTLLFKNLIMFRGFRGLGVACSFRSLRHVFGHRYKFFEPDLKPDWCAIFLQGALIHSWSWLGAWRPEGWECAPC